VQKFHEVRHAERVEVTKKSVQETPIGLTLVRQTKKRHPLASSASPIVLVHDEDEDDWGSGGRELRPTIAGTVCLKAIDQKSKLFD
jgi:hypothetical protein